MIDNRDERYRALIDRIKRQEPVMDNPERMAKRIMDSVGPNDAVRRVGNIPFTYIRIALSMSAVLTGILFFLSVYDDSHTMEHQYAREVYSVRMPDCQCGDDMDCMGCYRDFVVNRERERENNIKRLSNYFYNTNEL